MCTQLIVLIGICAAAAQCLPSAFSWEQPYTTRGWSCDWCLTMRDLGLLLTLMLELMQCLPCKLSAVAFNCRH